MVDESVGESFSQDRLVSARDKTLRVIEEVARQIVSGTSEDEAAAILAQVQARYGGLKAWHPAKIRFGANTLLPFRALSAPGVRLRENDIFFIDIGPIFDGHEGDVGRSYTVGSDDEMKKCCRDVERIWTAVREHWRKQSVSGVELYRFAESCAEQHGWQLAREKAKGHRIADFPHAAKQRGTIDTLSTSPLPNRWILEIQIRHPNREFGAFYEDLLS